MKPPKTICNQFYHDEEFATYSKKSNKTLWIDCLGSKRKVLISDGPLPTAGRICTLSIIPYSMASSGLKYFGRLISSSISSAECPKCLAYRFTYARKS